MMSRKSLSKDEAFKKAAHYCAYQERCHSEVRDKLYDYGLHAKEVEEAIAALIESGYINEGRFATQFAGGKFRMKNWGRLRIRSELKRKQVSDYNINKALKEIPEDAYGDTLIRLSKKKWASLGNEKSFLLKFRKTADYLLNKGFEADLVKDVLHRFQKNQEENPL